MAIVPVPLPPSAEARALLNHLLEHGDIVGRDTVGRTIIQVAVDDWALERLMTFDADAAELEDQGDGEPDADSEFDGPGPHEVSPPHPAPGLPASSSAAT